MGGATTTRVAADCQLPRPTVHRLLNAMAGQGLVDRDRGTGCWFLGPETYLLGLASATRYDVTPRARPIIQKLSRITGESAFFSVRRGDETVCLMREDGDFPVRSHVLYEGIRFPLGVASAGMAILAFLEPWERDEYVSRSELASRYGVEHTPANLLAHVSETRAAGYAVNPGLIVDGSWGMAAVVFGEDNRPLGAISLTGIEQRFAPPRRQDLGALLLREAHILTRRLQSDWGAPPQQTPPAPGRA
jgi:DNA-binding IclR family transcriptional regulator